MHQSRTSLWLDSNPALLASKSSARQALLRSAGIPFVVETAAVDERGLEQQLERQNPTSQEIALVLARAKASVIVPKTPDQLVIGADQTLSVGQEQLHKAATLDEARQQLQELSGKTHGLHSAVSVFCNGEERFSVVVTAKMTMRPLSNKFVDSYVQAAGKAILSSVGAYQLEGLGIHLFEAIEGDHATILGLPLFPLLKFLRANGNLAS